MYIILPGKIYSDVFRPPKLDKKYVEVVINDFTMYLIISKGLSDCSHEVSWPG